MVNERLTEESIAVSDGSSLSGREIEVLRLGREGATDKEIADAMAISVTTLRTYWTRVREKLGAVSRTHALVLSAASAVDAPKSDRRTHFVESLTKDRLSTWVWRGKGRHALLDAIGAAIFGFEADEKPVPAEKFLGHVWAPDRARFERFLLQGAELRPFTPIELRVGIPGEYRNLIRTTNLSADGGYEPTLLLASTVHHVFR